jgi:BirA family biotin operon repressor/biotin-[acetyl-CoA-carboxylase] ligase
MISGLPRGAAALARGTTPAVIGGVIHRLGEVDSTQAALARLARHGAPEGTVVTARHQTAGRGRLGRRWWDAPGESLLLSVLLRPAIPVAHAPQLSLVVGLAVSDALGSAAGLDARIRWPNDVLADGRKISGILPDAASGPGGRIEHVVVGIGINLDQAEFPADLAGRATSVRLVTGRSPDPARVLDALLAALDRRYAEWLASGFAGLREAWRGRSCTLGGRVRLARGGEGVAVDVDEDGALVVEGADGARLRVVSGDLLREGEGGDRCCS